MEFWKRKKGGAPPTPVNGNSNINPSTISGPIHNMEPQPPTFGGAPRSPVTSIGSDNGVSFGDAEFRERYKTYRQQRRQSHTSRSSQLTTGSNEGAETVYSQPPPMPSSGPQGMSRNWSHDEVGSSQQRAPSVISTASSVGSGGGLDGGPPRGSLRSTRSAATGRPLTGGSTSGVSGDQSMRSVNRITSVPSSVVVGGAFPSAATAMSTIHRVPEVELSEEEVNLMLGRLMDEMDLKDAQRLQMHQMSTPNKLRLLKQHKQFEAFPTDNRGNAPEYFYQSLIGTDIRTLPKQTLVHLRVCVSTQPVNWVKQFVEIQGLEALSDCLGILNHAGVRKGDDITKEMEIIKCIKSVVNIQWGAQDVLRYPTCVHNLCFSIDAPSLLTRRLISEILTYICYLNVPSGHKEVLKGLDKLQKFREMQKRFEPWMRALESAVDGRGRMGSKVGVSEELRQLGGTADRDLTDYVLSSMIFMNAVVGVPDDIEMRNHFRNQLHAAGLTRILKKLRSGFDSPLIALQINKYDKDAEQDLTDAMELYNQQIMQDMTDPEEVFQAILTQIDDDERSQEHFLSILQRLLLLRDDFVSSIEPANGGGGGGSTKARYYQLLDEITTQVVMDIRSGEPPMSDDSDSEDIVRNSRPNDTFTSQYGVSVAGIIDKFSNEEQLEEAVREAKDLREQLEKVTRQKNELELEVSLKSEGLVGTLKTKIFALEDLLRMSRHTIEALQTQIKELRDQFTQKLAKQDSQLKQLYSALQDEAGEHDMLRRLKDDLTLENEVLKSGVAWDEEGGLSHELLLVEIEKLKRQRPELNRMTEARQMLEKILADAGQGTPVRKPGKPVEAAPAVPAPPPLLPAGVKMGTVTMDSVLSTPTRLADFASELERKLGGVRNAAPEEAPSVTPHVQTLDSEPEDMDAAPAKPSTSVSTAAPPPLAPPPPPMLARANAGFSGASPPPPAPPPPPMSTGASPPPAPPPPLMPGGGLGAIMKPSPQALAGVQLRSTKNGSAGSSAAPSPSAPPPPPLAPAAPRAPGMAPPAPGASLLGPLRRKELVYVPKVKLKALQWDKLNDQHVESSLWSKLEDRAGLPEREVVDTLHANGAFENLERLFAAKQAVDVFALREKRRKEREEKALDEVSVLESKRAYNLNIMLGMLKKLTFADIRRALLRMDTAVISENLLKQLLSFVPTPEERGLLSAFHGQAERKRLARPDRFFLETMKVWRYEQRLRATVTWITWPESFRDVQADVASVMTAAHAVATSRHFPQVLEVVLSIGNFMNGSGFRGGAFGFRIASLNRLMDTKADDNKTTLLHFVASAVEENFPAALEFLDELKPVDSGCRVSYAEMKAEMGDMRVRLAEAKRELELLREQREKELKEVAMESDSQPTTAAAPATEDSGGDSGDERVSSASDPQDRFLLTMRRFLVEATEQYDALVSQFAAMDDAYATSVLLYGEDPRTMAPEEFFGIFKTFTASFGQSHRDNTRERERKRAAEKRRKQIEMQIEQKRVAKQTRSTNRLPIPAVAGTLREIPTDADPDLADTSDAMVPNGAENGAVDDLLKSLMAGTDLERVEATKRRRRRELMSIRRRSSVRRSVHRNSISIKALQMLRDIKEDEDDEPLDGDMPPIPSSAARHLRSLHRGADRMNTISEDDNAQQDQEVLDRFDDLDETERRAARRRQLLD
ncbi:hypothetical protein GGH94_002501 [Coemansia aciculifera]|uniref:FH2-domain-containing protein n=1 Tax=Coemansia aciculifera TaxID=417176 RepID=A0A9W8ILV5_9FUNG|nr:hypothetical protein GGH94_002501 [Coemansia aciculifera]